MNFARYLCLSPVIFLFACGSGSDSETKTTTSPSDTVQQVRKTKDELAALLPKEILGYKPKKAPEGLDMKMKNAEFSFTTQYYYNNTDSIDLELHDYLDGQVVFEHYADEWWLSGTQTDGPGLKSGLVDLGEGIDAWEVNHKNEKRVTIYAGVRNRYYLIFECYGKNDPQFIESVAKQFNYAPLLSGK